MDRNIYKIVALSLFLALLAAALYVYRPVENRYTRVTVTGNAESKVSPDTAVITFSVVTQGKKAVDAQQENARKSDAVRTAVEAVTSGAKTEIKTSSYNLSPEQDYSTAGMPKIVGYGVQNTVTVSINRLDSVGSIIDAATAAGANSVQGIQFIVGNDSPAQGDALAAAAAQAMVKADALARSINGRIVRVVQSIEGGVPVAVIDNDYGRSSNALANTSMLAKRTIPTPIEAGQVNLRSQVILIVDIET